MGLPDHLTDYSLPVVGNPFRSNKHTTSEEEIGKIATKNRQLRDSIQHSTLELEEKNRELAIEVALERVQSSGHAQQ